MTLRQLDPGLRCRASEHASPERIGVFRVTGLLGEGRRGAVYRGERDDGMFSQTVAIKLMPAGLAAESAVALFASERRIRAKLHHPNIAELLDGGVDQRGAAYIVMEFIDGVPITQFAATHSLEPTQKLALFRSACMAVQHAHQHLVPHGDLKPSNIRVSRAGMVKLLDFGLSSLLEGDAATTSSDVCSLGEVLRELLGQRTLRDADLRAIVGKATSARPDERYSTVPALIDDIDRYLDSRPVGARPATWRYVAARMIARYRWTVAGLATALLAMVIGGIVATVLYFRAEHLRSQANTRFDDVRQLANFMLFDLYDQMGRVPGSVDVRRELADRGKTYLETLAAIPGAPPDVTLEAAEGYARLAEVLGAPGSFHLGQPQEAKQNLAVAESMLRQMRARQPERDDIAVALAHVLLLRASIVSSVDFDAAGAMSLAEAARKLCEGALARDPANVEAMLWRWTSQNTLANALGWQNRMAEVIKLQRGELARASSVPSTPGYRVHRVMLEAASHNTLGDALYYTDDLPGSLEEYRRAVAVIEGARREESASMRGDDPRFLEQLGLVYWNMGGALSDLGRGVEADEALSHSTQVLERSIDYGSNDRTDRLLQSVRLQHAMVLSGLGQSAKAIALARASIANREKRLFAQPADRERHRDLAVGLRPLGDVYLAAKAPDAACATYARARTAWQSIEHGWGLAQFDRDVELRLLSERLSTNCTRQPKKSPALGGASG